MIKKLNEQSRLLLTCREAAYACGVDPKTWRMWDGLGIVPQPVRLHKSVFWRKLELVQWIEEDCPRRKDWVWRPNRKNAEFTAFRQSDALPFSRFCGSLCVTKP